MNSGSSIETSYTLAGAGFSKVSNCTSAMAWAAASGAARLSAGLETGRGEGDDMGAWAGGGGAGGGDGAKSYFHDLTQVVSGQGLADSLAIALLAFITMGPLTLGLAMARQSADTVCADASQAHPALRDFLSSAFYPVIQSSP